MKRIISLMLSLVIILGLVCGAVPAVSAASAMKTSNQGIEMIKTFEGFIKWPQMDNGQWTVGYGTGVSGARLEYFNENGITQAQATELLKEHLDSFEKSVNSFIDTHSLKLNQQQFDALVSFTYNLGPSWMQSGTFRTAVINGTKGNEFIYAMAQFGKAGGSPVGGLIERRLCEANLYLNGVYGNTPPANFKYVTYDGNMDGVVPTVTIQGYDSTQSSAVKSTVAAKTGYRFMGWYTAAEGGTWITHLGSKSTGTNKLYAHWQNGEGPKNDNGTIKGTAANYSGYSSNGKDKNVYKTPGGEKSGTVKGDALMTVSAEYVDSANKKWGKISTGWVDVTGGLASTPVYEKAGSEIDPITVTVTTGGVNNRIGPGTNYAKNGTYYKGQKLVITAKQKGGNYTWGKSEQGWIALQYTDYDTVKHLNNEDAKKVTAIGTIIRANSVNVRAGAGTNHAKVGVYYRNDEVKISLQQQVGNVKWGLTEKGWVSLYYVKLTEVEPGEVEDMDMTGGTTGSTGSTTGSTSNGNSTTVISTGKIYNCNTLRIRAAAGTSNAHIGDYASGTYVNIYETTTVRSEIWGRTDKGWISMRYVQLDAPTTGAGVTGRVFRTTTVNVRSGAGTHYPKVGKLTKGTKVEILEYIKVGNATWGRTSQGWVSLYYINLDTPLSNLDQTAADSAPVETIPPAETLPPADDTTATEPVVTKYTVTANTATNGRVTANVASAAKDTEVTLTITPDAGYGLESLTVKNASGAVVPVTNNKFTMPESNVTITATFKVQYNVKINTASNGKVTANTTACAPNAEVILTAAPDAGYELESLSVVNTKTNAAVSVSGGKFTMPEADVNVVATFKKATAKTFTVKINAATNGSVSASTVSAKENDVVTLTVNPNADYALDTLTVKDAANNAVTCRAVSGKANTYSFKMPASNVTIAASFKDAMYNVTIASSSNGSVSVNPDKYVKGATVTLDIAPFNRFELDTLTVTSGEKELEVKQNGDNYTFVMPAADVNVKATFKKIEYALTIADTVNGTVTAEKETYIEGAGVKLTVKPASGYSLEKLTVKSGSNEIETTKTSNVYSFTMPAGAVSVEATFVKTMRKVTIAETTHGTVTADKKDSVAVGETVTLTVKPDNGYALSTLTVKSGSSDVEVKQDGSTYTFTMPNAAVNVEVSFTARTISVTTKAAPGAGGAKITNVPIRLTARKPGSNTWVEICATQKSNGNGSITFLLPSDLPANSIVRPELVSGQGFDYAWNVTSGDRQVRTAATTTSAAASVVNENSQENLKITVDGTGIIRGSFVVEVVAK